MFSFPDYWLRRFGSGRGWAPAFEIFLEEERAPFPKLIYFGPAFTVCVSWPHAEGLVFAGGAGAGRGAWQSWPNHVCSSAQHVCCVLGQVGSWLPPGAREHVPGTSQAQDISRYACFQQCLIFTGFILSLSDELGLQNLLFLQVL